MAASDLISSNVLSTIPLRGDLNDKGEQQGINLESEEIKSPSGILGSAPSITLDLTVPALQAAYTKTFLTIPQPEASLSSLELQNQLGSFSHTFAKDVDTEASVNEASQVLAVIEAAIVAENKLLAEDQRSGKYTFAPDPVKSQIGKGGLVSHSQQLSSEHVCSVSDIEYTNGIALGTSSSSGEALSSATPHNLSSYDSATESVAFNSLLNRQPPSTQPNRLFAIMATVHHDRNTAAAASASIIETDVKDYNAIIQPISTSTTNSSEDTSEEEKGLNDISNELTRGLELDDTDAAKLQSKEAIDRTLADQQQVQQLQVSYRILRELLRSPGNIAVSA